MALRRWPFALALLAAGAALSWAALRGPASRRAGGEKPRAGHEGPADTPTVWPGPQAVVRAPAFAFPPGFGVRRVALDPGHGAPGNKGNSSSFCVDEQDFTLAAAEALGDRLEATEHFEIRLTREGDALVEYRDRVEDAAAWGAEALVSLHSDVRGKADRWSPAPGQSCALSLTAPGFSVLYSDEGPPPAAAARLGLARAVARRMGEAGLLAFAGYDGSYEPDPATPGVFVDRHPPSLRIFILRRTPMPAVLIETHNALDPREAQRWSEEATLDAFGAAVAAALVDVLGRPAEPTARRE